MIKLIKGNKIMKEFHIDEPREIGRKKQRLSRSDILNIKDELTEVVVRKKIRELIKKELKKFKIFADPAGNCLYYVSKLA